MSQAHPSIRRSHPRDTATSQTEVLTLFSLHFLSRLRPLFQSLPGLIAANRVNRPAWRRPAAPLAGLELGLRELHLVEVVPHAGQIHALRKHASLRLPAAVVHDAQHDDSSGIDDLNQLIDTVGQLWHSNDIQARRVAIGLPASMCNSATHDLDAQIDPRDEAQLQAAAFSHCESLLSCPAQDASIDYCLWPPASAGMAMRLFVAATRQDVVDDLRALSETLQLELLAIDISTYAEHTAWRHSQRRAPDVTGNTMNDSLTAILRLDDNALQCALFEGDLQRTDLSHTTQLTASGQYTTSETGTLLRAAIGLLRRSCSESATATPDQIVLTGTHATQTGLAAALRQQLSCAVNIAAPFEHLPQDAADSYRASPIPAAAYLAAYGLVLRALEGGHA